MPRYCHQSKAYFRAWTEYQTFFLLLVALTLTSNIGIQYDDDFADTTHADFATLETYLSDQVDILKMFCSTLNA